MMVRLGLPEAIGFGAYAITAPFLQTRDAQLFMGILSFLAALVCYEFVYHRGQPATAGQSAGRRSGGRVATPG